MPPVVFEPAIPASERPQTHTLDRAAAGICVGVCAAGTKYMILLVVRMQIFVKTQTGCSTDMLPYTWVAVQSILIRILTAVTATGFTHLTEALKLGWI